MKAPGTIVYKSGNPGYLSNYPVVASSTAITKTTAAKVPQNGFLMFDHGVKGECFTDKPNTVYDYHNRVLRFGQTQHLSCSQSFDLAELQKYCESGLPPKGSSTPAASPEWQKLKIFKQFTDSFKFVSRIGNPSISAGGDWVGVLTEDMTADVAGKWDA